jgi:HlyD family secretion protein
MLEQRKALTLPSALQPGKMRMLKAAMAALLVIGLSAGAWAGYQQYAQHSKYADAQKYLSKVHRGSIDLRISATGTVRPFNQVKLSPKYTGLIKTLAVQQGDHVKAGQIVAAMDDSNLLGQYRAAAGAYEAAKAAYEKTMHGSRLQEVADAQAQLDRAQAAVQGATMVVNRARAEITSIKAQLLRDETNARRMKQLTSAGAISDQDGLNAFTAAEMSRAQVDRTHQDLQQSEAALAQARAEYKSAQQKYSLVKEGFRKEDVEAARQAMAQAAGNLEYIKSQLDDTKIRAPFDGTVTQKYAEIGAIVAPTTASTNNSATSSSILSLAGRLEMVAAVAETDIENIHPGQEVLITAGAYPGRVFHGKVTLIAPEAIVTQNVTSFEIHTSIDDDPDGKLMSGMNVNSEFIAGRKENVLLIPTVSVVTKKARTGVFTPGPDGAPKFTSVKLGSTSDTETIVTEGLKEGDEIFIALSKEQLLEQGYTEKNILQPQGTSSAGSGQAKSEMKNKL